LLHEKFYYLRFTQNIWENFEICAELEHVVKIEELGSWVSVDQKVRQQGFVNRIKELMLLWSSVFIY
jgi:hypothetical protein